MSASSELKVKCGRCRGTGTIFLGKTFRAKSVKCPEYEGACWVPTKPKESK